MRDSSMIAEEDEGRRHRVNNSSIMMKDSKVEDAYVEEENYITNFSISNDDDPNEFNYLMQDVNESSNVQQIIDVIDIE